MSDFPPQKKAEDHIFYNLIRSFLHLKSTYAVQDKYIKMKAGYVLLFVMQVTQ
jgi:hypothetical protein